ncbi:MAG: Dipeptidyl-peptidase 5 [Fimbriimonadaceae bacterium]|nr:Dipeptidyl-peptidase 5 [Fimbriimonadaceae bacterium]
MPKRPIRAEDLLRIVFVGDPQISPDGQRVLYSRKHIDEKNKYVTQLCAVDMDGCVKQLTQGEGGAGNGRWSPDGTSIAFISGREKPAPQIFVLPLDGGEAKKLTSLGEGAIGDLNWSPDGKRIAFTYRPTHPNRTTEAAKKREEQGLSTPPWVLDDIYYRLDGDGYFGPQRHAIWVVELETGEARELYAGSAIGWYSFAWSPTGTELAVAHAVEKRPLAGPANDQIFRVDMDGQAWMLEGLPKGEKVAVAWSPDGKSIAYIGDDKNETGWGVNNTKLFVVSADGGSCRCLTGDTDYCLSVMGLSDTREAYGFAAAHWSPDSQAVYVSVGWHGGTQIGFVPIESGGVELLTKGNHTIGVGNISKDGERIACAWGDATHISEIAVYDLNEHAEAPRVLTHENQKFHQEIELVEPEELWLDSTDDTKVHAWVMKPVDYLEPQRYPAVLEIHGGPHAQYGWAFFHEFQLLASEGYVVVYSNPRGSKGYGEGWTAAIKGKWGDKDWADIQTVTRWMQHQPYIHPGRMGVMGGSYGGYMTNWAIGHTRDFKAAITDRCVSNMVSMGGSSDFPFVEDSYWPGAPWGNHEKVAELWRQSPLAYFDEVETPTLIIHSEGDLRCNIEQGEAVFSCLQQRGIESRFVRYPSSTSHGMSRGGPPDLRLHRLGEIVAWWKKHL